MRLGHAITATMAAGLFCLTAASPATAQPADLPIPAATTADYPPGVSLGTAGGIPVFVDKAGLTLYGMDMRILLRAGADASKYCRAECAAVWEPVLAPAGAKPNILYPGGFGDQRAPAGAPGQAAAPSGEYIRNEKAPDWTIIDGPQGPQWVYKGWHMVFVRKGDTPGSAAYEGDEDLTWNTLKYVPPAPTLAAPVSVATAFVGGAYALVDKDGRLLFTGDCGSDCAGWQPFSGGMASRGIGEWAVSRDADNAQWLFRGKPAFVAQGGSPDDLPAGAIVLRP